MYRVHMHRPYEGIEPKSNLGRKEPLSLYENEQKTGTVMCRIAIWDCFGCIALDPVSLAKS